MHMLLSLAIHTGQINIPFGVTLRSESDERRQISPTSLAGTIVVAVDVVDVEALSALAPPDMPLFEGLGVSFSRLPSMPMGEANRLQFALLSSVAIVVGIRTP